MATMASMPLEALKFQIWSGCGEPMTVGAPCSPTQPQQKNHAADIFLGKDYFTNPSQRSDNRKSEMIPRAPDVKSIVTKESLWIDVWFNPIWVKDRLPLKKTEVSSAGMHEAQGGGGGGGENIGGGVQEVLSSVEKELASLEQGMSPQLELENLASLMHKCTKGRNLAYALHLHAYVRRSGLENHRSLGNSLTSMLAEVGRMRDAQQVFDRLVYRNDCSWNSLIMGYIKGGEPQRALTLYQAMQQDDSVHPRGYTLVALLKACAQLKDLECGHEIAAEITRKGLLEKNIFIGSALVHMYAKCGLLAKAQEVFDQLPVRDTVSWSAIIAGYAEHGHGEEALNCFEQMQLEGVSPNSVTFVCSLKACGSIGATDKGQEIHAEIARKGLEGNVFVGSTLVDMYAKCGLLAKAQEVFDKLPVRNTVTWNALIAGYAEHGRGEEALNCFEQMQVEDVSPNAVTFVCSLKACGSIGDTDKGREIHAEIAKKGLLERDLVVGSTLVDMYAKCGLLAKAQEVFDKLPVRNTITWNVLITGYVEHGHGEEALNCFERMQLEGISPNAITFVCSLKACGSLGATGKGHEIHSEIARKGLLERDIVVGNTLVDMYAKCGLLAKAQEVFDKLPRRSAVSWDALIAGYAQLGESETVSHIFDKMIGEGVKPNLVTFLSVLNACSHAGLVDKGQIYFKAMSKDYGITQTLEHHTCMVDLLGRAGQLGKAVAMIKKLPFLPDLVVWNTMLGACQKWGNVELGRQAFEQAVQLDERDSTAYVCMRNIYADAGMQEDANKVEALRVKKQARAYLVD